MAKQVAKIGRYWTRTCTCGKEIPYFFLVCPHCKAVLGEKVEKPSTQKSTRIFAQVVAEGLTPVEANLVYTSDQGTNWYRIPMVREEDYFAATLPPMPSKTVIAYFLEAIEVSGKKYVEDNGGQYYFFEVQEEEKPEQELKTGEFVPFQGKEAPASTVSIPPQTQSVQAPLATKEEPKFVPPVEGATLQGQSPVPTKVPSFFSDQHRQAGIKKCQCGTILKEGWKLCPVCGQNVS
jgi:hypothetical protein